MFCYIKEGYLILHNFIAKLLTLLNCGVGEDSWVPYTARKSNQSILKELNPEYSLEGLMLNEAEAPIFWPPDEKNWLAGKDPDAGKDWRQEEKGMTEDKMVGWHHWLDGHVFEQALGLDDGQGSLACCTPWAGKDWTELNGTVSNYWNKLFLFTYRFLWILWKYFVVAVQSLSCDQLFVARFPCTSLSPSVCLNSCSLSWW